MSAPGRVPTPRPLPLPCRLAGAPGRDAAVRAKSLQWGPILCDPVDYSPTRLLGPGRFSRQEQRSGLPLGECSLGTSLAFSGTPYKREADSPSIYMDHPSSQTWCQFLESLGFPRGISGKKPTCQCRRLGLSLGREDPLEKGMATHSSIVAWRIPQRGAWQATVHGITKSWTRLSD